MNEPFDSRPDTEAHIARVRDLISGACANLSMRAEAHDKSKLEEPEKTGYDQIGFRLQGITYGSEEYRASLRELKPTIQHHYAHNYHHPEHYENGVDGMSLFDVLEMLLDWKAAGERHADGNIHRSLELNRERFKLSPQLENIMANTIKELGW